jgi:hypothetical protein
MYVMAFFSFFINELTFFLGSKVGYSFLDGSLTYGANANMNEGQGREAGD